MHVSQGAESIMLHDAVRLLPAPGDTSVRIGRLEALWSDKNFPELQLAVCRMYVHPKVRQAAVSTLISICGDWISPALNVQYIPIGL